MEYNKATTTQKRSLITNAQNEHSRLLYKYNKITLIDFNENDLVKLVSDIDNYKYNI